MSVELTPLGVQCNLSCTYCYQTPMRDAGNIGNKKPYDMDKMLAALEKENTDFLVFGGEPLLVPLPDLEQIWAWGHKRYGKNGTQTNGVLITPAHIAAFKRYAVHVGFSLDGPGELNDSRWHGTLERTRESTAASHANLRACVEAGVSTSVIITLYKGNALPDRLPQLLQWIRDLDALGSRGVRIHLLEVDHPLVRKRMQLSQEETIAALRALVDLERTLPRLRLDILTDMRALLRAEDEQVTCIWNPCDPYTTSAVQGIDGQGNRSNCGRTNKDGIARLKAAQPGFERQVALAATPYADGGCQGCRFFLMCKGQCPGTAIDGDWRNRTQDCQVWMSLFETLEAEFKRFGITPLSLDPRREKLEQHMLHAWGEGRRLSLKRGLQELTAGAAPRGHAGNRTHTDVPHGDTHGDHWDAPKETH